MIKTLKISMIGLVLLAGLGCGLTEQKVNKRSAGKAESADTTEDREDKATRTPTPEAAVVVSMPQAVLGTRMALSKPYVCTLVEDVTLTDQGCLQFSDR
jgi:hypothetical protein